MKMSEHLHVATLVSHGPNNKGLEAATSIVRFLARGLVELTDRSATGDGADGVGGVGAELDIEQGLGWSRRVRTIASLLGPGHGASPSG